MSSQKRYIVSFIVDDQPDNRVIEVDAQTLSPEEAEALLRITFRELQAATISDVQVQKKIKSGEEEHDVPGHYKQP